MMVLAQGMSALVLTQARIYSGCHGSRNVRIQPKRPELPDWEEGEISVVGINAAAAVGRSEERLSDAAPQPPSTGLLSDQSRLDLGLKLVAGCGLADGVFARCNMKRVKSPSPPRLSEWEKLRRREERAAAIWFKL